jgi:hypothetical protein
MGVPKVKKKRKMEPVVIEGADGSEIFACVECGKNVRLDEGQIITCATCSEPHVVCERCFRSIKVLEGWD